MCQGKLYIVGIGPGHRAQMTLRAQEVIALSEVVVGYTTYIDLLGQLVENKRIIVTGMTQEIDRVGQALDQVRLGKVVSLVSSGDPGLYGMAGLAFDLIQDGEDIDIEVIPGVTAAFSCAAILGAPIMHDLAIISLSNRLTSKELILKRVQFALESDFVLALYNPRSRTRKELFGEVCDLLNQYRSPHVPVGLVWQAYRESETSSIISLGELKIQAERINMFTTIIAGNSTTVVKNGRMITARGYEAKKNFPIEKE